MKPLSVNQLEFIGPLAQTSLIFLGEFRGGEIRSNTFDVKDKAGKPTGGKDTIETWEGVMEISPPDGLGSKPIVKQIRLGSPKKGQPLVAPKVERGQYCVVVVKAMKYDEFSKENVVIAGDVLPLPPALADGKAYEIKATAKEGAK